MAAAPAASGLQRRDRSCADSNDGADSEHRNQPWPRRGTTVMAELPWEDSLLERKVESDLKDLRKTLVAFANSVRPGHVATILIGERDDGSVQGVSNPDGIQKKVREECDEIYPPIVWSSQVYEKTGMPCLRVEIEFNGETPHFG